MPYRVVYSRAAQTDLAELERYIAGRGSPRSAASYVEAIVARCEDLALAPYQGTRRDGAPGLRTTGFRRRVTIAFRVTPGTILIAGVFYGGRRVRVSR
jgi:plasmid stabilization system protein ParE